MTSQTALQHRETQQQVPLHTSDAALHPCNDTYTHQLTSVAALLATAAAIAAVHGLSHILLLIIVATWLVVATYATIARSRTAAVVAAPAAAAVTALCHCCCYRPLPLSLLLQTMNALMLLMLRHVPVAAVGAPCCHRMPQVLLRLLASLLLLLLLLLLLPHRCG
jgi:hypothetical protein